MNITAREFMRGARKVWRAARDGEKVVISHDQYEEVFELTARKRQPLADTEERASNEDS